MVLRDTAAQDRLLVEPCPRQKGAFRWRIQRSGQALLSSPYAFASEGGARLSGELWLRETRSAARSG